MPRSHFKKKNLDCIVIHVCFLKRIEIAFRAHLEPPPPVAQPRVYILICVMDLPDKGLRRSAASGGRKD